MRVGAVNTCSVQERAWRALASEGGASSVFVLLQAWPWDGAARPPCWGLGKELVFAAWTPMESRKKQHDFYSLTGQGSVAFARDLLLGLLRGDNDHDYYSHFSLLYILVRVQPEKENQ